MTKDILTNRLCRLSPELWGASLFRCTPLVAAVGRSAVIAAFALDADLIKGSIWDPLDYEFVGMTDYGSIGITRSGALLAPEQARAPAGGLDLGSLLKQEIVQSELDFGAGDGIIIARLPGGRPAIAAVGFTDSSIAHVEARLPYSPDSRSQSLLSTIGIRRTPSCDINALNDPSRERPMRHAHFEIDLRTHFDRTRRAGPQPAAPGACNGYFVYSGKSPKSREVMHDALDLACREHHARLSSIESPSPHLAKATECPIARSASAVLDLSASGAGVPNIEAALATLTGELDDAGMGERKHWVGPVLETRTVLAALETPRQRTTTPSKPGHVRRTASSPGPAMSLSQTLSSAIDRLSSHLLSAPAADELLLVSAAISDSHGPNPIALEIHFGGTESEPPAVDLLACWSWNNGALAQPITLVDPPDPLGRLDALWADGPYGPLIEQLDQLWLEFDAGHGGRPMPAVFFTARARRERRADIVLPLCQTVASTLYATGGDDPFQAACRTAASLAGRVPIPNVGLMFPRPQSPLRLIVAPGVWDDTSNVEHWLAEDATGGELGRVWSRLKASFGRALPALDLGAEGLLSSRGMELRIDRGPLRRSQAAWQAPMDALHSEGLITQDEAQAFASCFAQYRIRGGEWMSIIPAYIKIAIDSSGALCAKGYISIQRSQVPAYEIGA